MTERFVCLNFGFARGFLDDFLKICWNFSKVGIFYGEFLNFVFYGCGEWAETYWDVAEMLRSWLGRG